MIGVYNVEALVALPDAASLKNFIEVDVAAIHRRRSRSRSRSRSTCSSTNSMSYRCTR
ncbi:hypothetical protein AB5I41_14445 [Sphingomonas sp. MMS24-JH45]